MSSIISTLTYSDQDMQCPSDWENGFKEARVMRFGDGERTLSHMRTGDWQGAQFSLTISDFDRSIRERLNSEQYRYWSDPWTIRITDRATRAAKETPYTVFVGPIIDARCTDRSGLAWDFTLGDIVSQGLLSDQAQAPWRRIGDGFLSQLTKVADELDRDTPEPIIYGIHNRLPDDAPVGAGLVYKPTYLGIIDDGGDQHVWLVAGHACADVPPQYVDGLVSVEFTAQIGVDFISDTYGNVRRYTLIYAPVTDPGFLDPEVEIDQDPDVITDPDACALGIRSLTVSVEGIEPNGDGSGEVITDRLDQYKHFAINYIANQGANSYQSGAWLDNPTWDIFGVSVPIVETGSWTAAKAISLERFPGDGYTGAWIIGATSGDRRSLREWIAGWNRSCSVRFGITNLGRMRVFMLHPTEAIKAAAPLIEETNDILRDSFLPWVRWSEHANRIPFKYDFNHATGQWLGVNTYDEGVSIVGYNRVIPGETREYPAAPGITNAYHLAIIEGRIARFPPRGFTADVAVSSPLTVMDLGDYVRYRHYASIGSSASEIRLGYIERHQVQAGRRRTNVDILDVEDLIGFDAASTGSPDSGGLTIGNETCATAYEFTLNEDNWARVTQDTTLHATDSSAIFGSPLGEAFHAAWYRFEAPSDGNLSVVNGTTAYNSVTRILEGTCGASPSWTELNMTDEHSGITVDLLLGDVVYILVHGQTTDDGGFLLTQISFAPA
jgi:hypothetical protein